MSLPPYAQILDVRQSPGDARTLVMPFSPDISGRPGFLQGGVIAGFLELAALTTLRSALGARRDDVRVVPVSITIDYMRGGRALETCATGAVTRLGSRVANVTAMAWQDDRDRPIATARLTFLLAEDGDDRRDLFEGLPHGIAPAR